MKRILFVDADPRMKQDLRGVWAAMPATWQMELCDSGAAALSLMEQKVFDVVVANMNLPGMSGSELLARCWPAWRHVVDKALVSGTF